MYDRNNPPLLVTEALPSTGRAARTFVYFSTDDTDDLLVQDYFTNGYDLGFREGDMVVHRNLEIGLWHIVELVVSDVTFTDPVWHTTLSRVPVVADTVPTEDDISAIDYLAAFVGGAMVKIELPTFFTDTDVQSYIGSEGMWHAKYGVNTIGAGVQAALYISLYAGPPILPEYVADGGPLAHDLGHPPLLWLRKGVL